MPEEFAQLDKHLVTRAQTQSACREGLKRSPRLRHVDADGYWPLHDRPGGLEVM